MIELQSFQEKVYGNLGVVYHRTKSVDIAKGILEKGFIPGEGEMYGRGLYTTYDLESQMHDRMIDVYGPIILKFKISLHNFLILDYDVAKVVYGTDYTLIDQMKKIDPSFGEISWKLLSKMDKNKIVKSTYIKIVINNHSFDFGQLSTVSPEAHESNTPENLAAVHKVVTHFRDKTNDSNVYLLNQIFLDNYEKYAVEGYREVDFKDGSSAFISSDWQVFTMSSLNPSLERDLAFLKDLSSKLENTKYTSEIAIDLSEWAQQNSKINGLVFTGKKDGKVAVVYNYDAVTPMAYCDVPTLEWSALPKPNAKPITGEYLRDLIKTAGKLDPELGDSEGEGFRTSITPSIIIFRDKRFFRKAKPVTIVKNKFMLAYLLTNTGTLYVYFGDESEGIAISKNNEMKGVSLYWLKDCDIQKIDPKKSSTWILIKSPQATQRAFQNLMKGYHS